MKYKYKQIIFSGICKCGHSWENHHLGIVINEEAVREHKDRNEPLYVPMECEHYGFNELGGCAPDNNGNWIEHCSSYIDKEDDNEDAE